MKKIYMIVTADKYEMPLAVGTLDEICERLHRPKQRVWEKTCRDKRKLGKPRMINEADFRLVAINMTDEEFNEIESGI